MVKIRCQQGGITVQSLIPTYKYDIKEDGEIIDVPEEHADKILRSPMFEKVKSLKKADKGDL